MKPFISNFVTGNLYKRVTAILLNPQATWEVIRSERLTVGQIYREYLVPIALIPAVATFIGRALVGIQQPYGGVVRTPIIGSVVAAVFTFGLTLLGIFIAGKVINALAPNFAASRNDLNALKLAAYSWTPAILATVFYAYPPWQVAAFLCSLYAIYLLYLGLPILLDCPPENTVGYTLISIVVMVALYVAVYAASVGSSAAYQLGFGR